jgi:hypothetical protein
MSTCKSTWQSRHNQPTVIITKEDDMTTNLYKAAEKRAKAKLGFYIHATVFVMVSAMQFGINLFTTPWVFWSFFPFMGWGLGLAIHGLVVWFKTSDLREQMIESELERMTMPRQFTSSAKASNTGKVSVTVRDAD